MRPLARSIAAALLFVAWCTLAGAAPEADNNGAEPEPSSPAAAEPRAFAESALGPIENYRVIVERPLFMMTRRPSGPGDAQLADSAHFMLTLTGIIVEGGERQAVFRHQEQRRPLRLSVGMSRQGWELQNIADDHVVFRRGAQSLRLALDYGRPSPTAPEQPGKSQKPTDDTEESP
jgi:hypothetical protein